MSIEKDYWYGKVPKTCNICHSPIEGTFVDGRMKDIGTWAFFCVRCHNLYGAGFGPGKGQRYAKEEGIRIYYKVEG